MKKTAVLRLLITPPQRRHSRHWRSLKCRPSQFPPSRCSICEPARLCTLAERHSDTCLAKPRPLCARGRLQALSTVAFESCTTIKSRRRSVAASRLSPLSWAACRASLPCHIWVLFIDVFVHDRASAPWQRGTAAVSSLPARSHAAPCPAGTMLPPLLQALLNLPAYLAGVGVLFWCFQVC